MTPFPANINLASKNDDLPTPANNDAPRKLDHATMPTDREHKLVAWLFRASRSIKTTSLHRANHSAPTPEIVPLSYASPDSIKRGERFLASRTQEPMDDWQTVASLCGHAIEDFKEAHAQLPLTTAEIDHFRRNHREADHLISRDFLTIKSNLPSPLAELYGLYRHRARLDTESALFVAQATSSTRVAQTVADLLAIGGYANGHECIAHISQTYSVPAAFDTSALIDKANAEVARRLDLSIDHPAHLLKLSPDEISVLAANIVESHILSAADFLDKANKLSEARQDVSRLPSLQRFLTSLHEGDLPLDTKWVERIADAYKRIFKIGETCASK